MSEYPDERLARALELARELSVVPDQRRRFPPMLRSGPMKLWAFATIVGPMLGTAIGLINFTARATGLRTSTVPITLEMLWAYSWPGLLCGLYLGGLGALCWYRVREGYDQLPGLSLRLGIALSFIAYVHQMGWGLIYAPAIAIFYPELSTVWGRGTGQSLRGARAPVSQEQLASILRRKSRHHPTSTPGPLLQIGGVELPSYLETLGIFTVGAPGSGKTQAILQLLETMRERPDFRVICLDRNGEILEQFYDSGDIIFNPSDRRSVGWNHRCEPVPPETIAESLVPDDPKNPFFSDAARSLLADLYERTHTNAQMWEALAVLNLEELTQLVEGGLSSRYMGSGKTAASVLSTLVNQTRFYRSLSDRNAFSFVNWAESPDPAWIFLPLFERDAAIHRPLYSCLFDLVLLGLLSNERRGIKTAIVIDELGALQKLPKLARLLAEGRKFKASALLGTQTHAQVTKVYGEEDVNILLQGTATKLVLNCRDYETADVFARQIGQTDRIDITTSKTREPFHWFSSTTKSEQIRDTTVVSIGELQTLPPLTGYLAISDGSPAAQVTITPQSYGIVAERWVR